MVFSGHLHFYLVGFMEGMSKGQRVHCVLSAAHSQLTLEGKLSQDREVTRSDVKFHPPPSRRQCVISESKARTKLTSLVSWGSIWWSPGPCYFRL